MAGRNDISKTAGALLLLALALPLNLALTAVALLRGKAPEPRQAPAANRRTILLSGGKMTKALQLARSFDRAGHRVILVESAKYRLTGHRFSRAVDRFYTVPRPESERYADALLSIVEREAVDIYVPVCSPAASWHDAKAKARLEPHCEVLHLEPEMVSKLDDKAQFCDLAASLGLGVPDTHRITEPQQVLDFDFPSDGTRYILKSINYDPVRRLDLTRLPLKTQSATKSFLAGLPISEENPWILQEFVSGQEYCTHSTVRDGEICVYCCCRSEPFLLNYEMAPVPEIEQWVRRFVAELKLSGQVSFDFIRAEDGSVYAIECNPRTHTAVTMLYDHPGVADAYLGDGPEVRPLPASRPTFWLYHELWRALSMPRSFVQRIRTLSRGKDAIFDWADPLPFLMVHHLQIPALLLPKLFRAESWIRVDFNIGKLVEPAGD